MKKIEPYTSVKEAMESLDNGGRFYNIFTKPNDGKIETAELAKVGGLFNDKQKMILFLDLAISLLKDTERQILVGRLDESLLEAYDKFRPIKLHPSEFETQGTLSKGVIVSGTPVLLKSVEEFSGFIMIPIIAGNVTTFSMIPLIEEYYVYTLQDERDGSSFLMAHSKSTPTLKEQPIAVAGVVKEFKTDKDENGNKRKFLESVYYREI